MVTKNQILRIRKLEIELFVSAVASDDGIFFTPKSLASMIVNIIEPSRGTVLDKAVTILIQGIH